jgi:dihydroorotase
MKILIKDGIVFYKNRFRKLDILITKDVITDIAPRIRTRVDQVINARELTIIPGLIDVHVHLREPGFSYKETIKTGTLAASYGGYTTICCMPNTNPLIDSLAHLNLLDKMIKRDAIINVLPYACISKGQTGNELVNIAQLAKHCFAFSDDGVGVSNAKLLKQGMIEAKKVHASIVVHCEDLTKSGNASEYSEVERDLKLANETKCQLHICHVSTKESIEFIKEAKKTNKLISCEVTPHHLLINETHIKDHGSYKMNPPIRSQADQQRLLQALYDGTIDMIATDHAPHNAHEKNKGLKESLNGVVGLEFAFSLIYTFLVKTNKISFKHLIDLMSANPAKIFKIEGGEINIGKKANLALFNLNKKYVIDSKHFASKGKSTPFVGLNV